MHKVRWKKIVSVFLIMAMMVVSMSGISFAAEVAMVIEAADVSAELSVGGTVSVDVKAIENNGYAQATLLVEWDKEALQLGDIKFTALAPDNSTPPIGSNTGKHYVSFGSPTWKSNKTDTGTLVTLVFKVLSGAELGKSYSIGLSHEERNCLDADGRTVISLDCTGGSITFKNKATSSDIPTTTPKPTATPKPTRTPTATPKPTSAPTATPKPTDVPTVTPAPSSYSRSSSTLLSEKSSSTTIASGSNIDSYSVEPLTVAVKYDLYEEQIVVRDRKGDVISKLEFELREEGDWLPERLNLSPDGIISGIPMESGDYILLVHVFNKDMSVNIDVNIPLKVHTNSDSNVLSYTDEGYYLIDLVSDLDLGESGWSVMRSEGDFSEFTDLYLDGEKLTKGNAPGEGEAPELSDNEDYYAEEGSTRLTIKNQTLTKKGTSSHTLAMEFKDSKTGSLRRAAQNYTVKETSAKNDTDNNTNNNKNNNNNNKNNNTNNNTNNNNNKNNNTNNNTNNTKTNTSSISSSGSGGGSSGSFFANNALGIISGRAGRAYTSMSDTPGAWEFGSDGSWYFRKEDGSLWTGWIVFGHYWFYLDEEGRMCTGWQKINDKWYYFNDVSDGTLGEGFTGWHYINGKWYYFYPGDDIYIGQMYVNSVTPDGYYVGADGSRSN